MKTLKNFLKPETLNWLWAAVVLYIPLALFEPPLESVLISMVFLIHFSLIGVVSVYNFVIGFKEFMDSIEQMQTQTQ